MTLHANYILGGYDRFTKLRQLSADLTFFQQLSTILLGYGTGSRQSGLEPQDYLANWLRMGSSDKDYWRSQFLSHLGLTETEAGVTEVSKGSEDFCPLGALTATNLLSGPFRIAFTEKASEHLTFRGSSDRSVLQMLSLEKVKTLYIPQRIGIAT